MVWVFNLHLSLSMKVIALVVSKKALLAWDSTIKHSTPEFATILMRDSIAILLTSGPNPS